MLVSTATGLQCVDGFNRAEASVVRHTHDTPITRLLRCGWIIVCVCVCVFLCVCVRVVVCVVVFLSEYGAQGRDLCRSKT